MQDVRKMIIKSCKHCNTHPSWNYRARPSRCWQHPCAHRALLPHFTTPWWTLKSCKHRIHIERCLHQAGTIAARCPLARPQPWNACDFQKEKALIRARLSAVMAQSSQEIEGKSAAVELQTHRRPFMTKALNISNDAILFRLNGWRTVRFRNTFVEKRVCIFVGRTCTASDVFTDALSLTSSSSLSFQPCALRRVRRNASYLTPPGRRSVWKINFSESFIRYQ